jgi:hypothetical protein
MGTNYEDRFWVHGNLDNRGFDVLGFIGPYFSERYSSELQNIIKSVSEQDYDNLIYNY